MLHRLHSRILHLIQFNIVYPSLRLSEPRGPQPPAAEARYAFLRRLLPTHHRSSPPVFPLPPACAIMQFYIALKTILHCIQLNTESPAAAAFKAARAAASRGGGPLSHPSAGCCPPTIATPQPVFPPPPLPAHAIIQSYIALLTILYCTAHPCGSLSLAGRSLPQHRPATRPSAGCSPPTIATPQPVFPLPPACAIMQFYIALETILHCTQLNTASPAARA